LLQPRPALLHNGANSSGIPHNALIFAMIGVKLYSRINCFDPQTNNPLVSAFPCHDDDSWNIRLISGTIGSLLRLKKGKYELTLPVNNIFKY
jgi:hypothetical protein